MGWGEYLVIADTPELGRDWEDLVRGQCPTAEVTALPELAPEFWAAVFGVDSPAVEVCTLCGRLTCPGCGPSMVVFVLEKAHLTACRRCLGHGIDHYFDPGRARTARQQALSMARERHRSPFPGLSGLRGAWGALRGGKARKIEAGGPQRGPEAPEEMMACSHVQFIRDHVADLLGQGT